MLVHYVNKSTYAICQFSDFVLCIFQIVEINLAILFMNTIAWICQFVRIKKIYCFLNILQQGRRQEKSRGM